MLPRARNAAAPGLVRTEGERNRCDRLAGGSVPSLAAEVAALARVSGSLALVVWTDNGTKSLTRTMHSTRAADRAVQRAQERGDRVAVVLVRLQPVLSQVDPSQLDLMITDDGAA